MPNRRPMSARERLNVAKAVSAPPRRSPLDGVPDLYSLGWGFHGGRQFRSISACKPSLAREWSKW